jgi:hypothetical protein
MSTTGNWGTSGLANRQQNRDVESGTNRQQSPMDQSSGQQRLRKFRHGSQQRSSAGFTRAVAAGTTSTRRWKQLGLDVVKITGHKGKASQITSQPWPPSWVQPCRQLHRPLRTTARVGGWNRWPSSVRPLASQLIALHRSSADRSIWTAHNLLCSRPRPSASFLLSAAAAASRGRCGPPGGSCSTRGHRHRRH